MKVRYLVLLLLLSLVVISAKCDPSPLISTFTEETKIVSNPLSYYDYMLDEKTGRLVYAFCEAADPDAKFTHMSCKVTIKIPAFLGSAFNKTCTADFTSEEVDLLKLLNAHYAHHHKIVLLDGDKVLLAKNSWRSPDPVTMELIIVRISDCSVRVVNTTTNLEPHLHPKKHVFDVIYFVDNPKKPCYSACYVRTTYNYEGRLVFGPVRYTFSDHVLLKSHTFWEPLHIGLPSEFSYLQTFDTDGNGHAYHTLYKGMYSKNATEELVKTENAIMGVSMINHVSSFCWLSGEDFISCRQYDSKGHLKLDIRGAFFNDSIPWETKVTVKTQMPSPNLYKSKQLKLHNLQNGELMLVTLSRVCQITDDYLITQKESFQVVKIDSSGKRYTKPLKIQIQDELFQNFKIYKGINPGVAKNLYLPRVNVLETNKEVCFATWWDSSVIKLFKLKTTINFNMKCLSKSYFESNWIKI